MPSYQTEAMVLKRINYGEKDRILTLFTPDRGKVTAIAKGVRKPGSRLAGHIEGLSCARVELATGRSMDILRSAQSIERYPAVVESFDRAGFAMYFAELVEKTAHTEDEHGEVFDLLRQTLAQLKTWTNLNSLSHFFEFRLLDHLGYAPPMESCVVCSATWKDRERWQIDLRHGEIHCASCARQNDATMYSRKTLAYLHLIKDHAVDRPLQPTVKWEVTQLLQAAIHHVVGQTLKTRTFLEKSILNQSKR